MKLIRSLLASVLSVTVLAYVATPSSAAASIKSAAVLDCQCTAGSPTWSIPAGCQCTIQLSVISTHSPNCPPPTSLHPCPRSDEKCSAIVNVGIAVPCAQVGNVTVEASCNGAGSRDFNCLAVGSGTNVSVFLSCSKCAN